MNYIKDFIYAYMCTIGFAFLFNVPKNSILRTGFGGALGWTIYSIMNYYSHSVVISAFIASFIIALMGEVFAIREKQPVTIFIIPAIVPLVPGFGLYYTVLSILEKDYDLAIKYGSESLLIAISIAGALTVVLSLNSYRKEKKKV